MQDTSYDFLLTIQLSPVPPPGNLENWKAMEVDQTPRHIPLRTIGAALRELLAYPIDKFHPHTASLYGMDSFVTTAVVTDMRSGEQVMKLEHTPQLQNLKPAVSLRFEPVTLPLLLDPKLDGVLSQYGDFPVVLPLFLYSKNDACLLPTPEFPSIFNGALLDKVPADMLAPHHFWFVQLEGEELGKAKVAQGKLEGAPIYIREIFPDPISSLSYLMHLPMNSFNAAGAIDDDLPVCINSGVMLTSVNEEKQPVAAVYSTAQRDNGKGNLNDSGLFLYIPAQAIDIFGELGVAANQAGETSDGVLVRIGEWTGDSHSRLKPTLLHQEVVNTLSGKNILPPHLFNFTITVRQQKMMSSPDHPERPKQLTTLVETHNLDSFQSAVFEMLLRQGPDFTGPRPSKGKPEERIEWAKIRDSKGETICRMLQGDEVNFLGEGWFIGIRGDWLANMQKMGLHFGTLLQGGLDTATIHEQMSYFQVAKVEGKKFASTIGYDKFVLQVNCRHMTDFAHRYPELVGPKIQNSNTAPYAVLITWRVGAGNGYFKPMTTYLGFQTDGSAAEYMHFQFGPDAFSGEKFGAGTKPFNVFQIELLQGAQQQKVAVVGYNAQVPGVLHYGFNSSKASPELRAAMTVIYADPIIRKWRGPDKGQQTRMQRVRNFLRELPNGRGKRPFT